MFSSVGGFRFISAGGLQYGVNLTQNLNEVNQGFQTFGGNTFFVGRTGGANDNIVMNKFDINNQQSYGTKLTGTNTQDFPNNLILDTNYNQIVVGLTNANTVGNYDMYLSKFDSTGNLTWQRTIGTNTDDRLVDVCLTDSEANIIAVGSSDSNTNAWVGKFASSNGALLNQYTMNLYTVIHSVTSDSSNNLYMLITQDTNPDGVLVLKCTSNFTNTWGRYIEYGGNINISGSGIAVDSGGNVFATVRRPTADEDYLFKFNSSGTLQWQTGFNFGTNNGFYALTTDPSNNLYIAGDFGTPVVPMLLKFDTNGTLTFGRGLNGYNGTQDAGVNNISWYNNRILMNGYSFYNATRYGMCLNVPDNGSLAGTYANGYVWGFSPFSLVSSSLTVSSGAAPNWVTETLTDSAGTLTSSSYSVSFNPTIPF